MAVNLTESDERRTQREAAEHALLTRPFVDVRTIVLATGTAEKVIRDAIARGEIRTVRFGRSIRIPTAPLRKAWGLA